MAAQTGSRRAGLARDALLVGGLLLFALALRLPNLGDPTLARWEAIRLQQLLLMSSGFHACGQIFCNEGMYSIQWTHPLFELLGCTLTAARATSMLASLASIVGVYWIARQLWGRPAAVAAGLLLAPLPTFLNLSRLAFAELLALTPAVLAVGCAFRYNRGGARPWLFGAAALCAISLIAKPIAGPVLAPVGFLCLFRAGRRFRDLLLAGGVFLAVIAIGCVVVGLPSIQEQIVFRAQSRVAENQGRGLRWNLERIAELAEINQPGVFVLALAGAVGLAARQRFNLLAIGGWLLANGALLAIHNPLQYKHLVIMLPPTVLLAGFGVQGLAGWLTTLRHRRSPSPAAALASLGVVAFVATLPPLIERDRVLMFQQERLVEAAPPEAWYDRATAELEATTSPGSFVLTDFQHLAFFAGRPVPPQLVETSMVRIRSGRLDGNVSVDASTPYDPQAALLWRSGLQNLPEFKRWLDDNFQVVRVYSVDSESWMGYYLRTSADLAAARAPLVSGASNASGARFGDGLVVTGWGLDSSTAAPNDLRSLTITWEAIQPTSRDLAAIISLRSGERAVWTSERMPLLGGGDGQRQWAAGRWLVWTGLVDLPGRLQPGSYRLSVRVARGERGGFLPLTTPDGMQHAADDPHGLELATIDVSGPARR